MPSAYPILSVGSGSDIPEPNGPGQGNSVALKSDPNRYVRVESSLDGLGLLGRASLVRLSGSHRTSSKLNVNLKVKKVLLDLEKLGNETHKFQLEY